MLRIYAEKYLALGRRMEKAAQTLTEAEKKVASADVQNSTTANLLNNFGPLAERMGLQNDLQAMSGLCSEIDLPVAQNLIHRAMTDAPQTAREFSALANAIEAELKSKLFLFVPSYRASYAQDDRVSLQAKTNFPRATAELRRASVCYAFGEHTAAVFHAMRAAEIGVRVLAKTMGVTFSTPIERQDWQPILNAIHGEIKRRGNLPKVQQDRHELTFFANAAAHLQFCKDGWRVRASHAGELFDENTARTAIDSTRQLLSVLTDRGLSENS